MLAAIALAVSLLFPNIQARALTGEQIETKQHQGAPVVYLIGFTHESRAETDAWKRTIAKVTNGSLRAVEMPVLSGMAVMMRPVIENSMTRKTPPEERADIQTTTDRSALVSGLQLADPDRAAVIALVDAKGAVKLMLRGGPTPEQEAELLSVWNGLRP